MSRRALLTPGFTSANYSTQHDRGTRVAPPTYGHRRITAVLRVASKSTSPRDLPNHRCINISMGAAGCVPLGLRERLAVAGGRRPGSLVIDDMDITLRAAMAGVGR